MYVLCIPVCLVSAGRSFPSSPSGSHWRKLYINKHEICVILISFADTLITLGQIHVSETSVIDCCCNRDHMAHKS